MSYKGETGGQNSLMFEIADLFDMELTRTLGNTLNCLSGEEQKPVVALAGLDWALPVKVADSASYTQEQKVGALLHIGGSLWVVVLVDEARIQEERYLQVWLVDGSKLHWSPHSTTWILPATWNRASFYRKFVAGVVASYTRFHGKNRWYAQSNAKEAMAQYIESKRTGETDAERVVQSLRNKNWPVLDGTSERYRTKGPRGV